MLVDLIMVCDGCELSLQRFACSGGVSRAPPVSKGSHEGP